MKSIQVNIAKQTLCFFEADKLIKEYRVSTAKNGAGEIMHSECTPRGKHVITEKIGADAKSNAVFVGRVETGEVYQAQLRDEYPDRDWILTRILRLGGCEDGVNAGGDVDSHERYIYIHGSPDDVEMGKPGSHGCVRMRNQDIIELFELVDAGTEVNIIEA